jgi:GNAT superfamily N-acetyltransferase
VVAYATVDSFSLTIGGDQIFGMGLGPNAHLVPQWQRFTLDHSTGLTLAQSLLPTDEWDFYSLNTEYSHVDNAVEALSNHAEISELLTTHAADSSVWPSSPEVAQWYGLRAYDGTLQSVGALVRWESGMYIVASVATVAQVRGRGLAQQLIRGIVGEARELGIIWLGLGVSHSNIPAHRVYEQCGFELRAAFTTYVR